MKKYIVLLLVFITNLSFSQNYEWTKVLGSTSNDFIDSVVTDQNGNIYSLGSFHETVDFDPGIGTFNLTSSSVNYVFLQKLDPNGNLMWVKFIEGNGENGFVSGAITIDIDENIIFTGSMHIPFKHTNVVVCKFDNQGNVLFHNEYSDYADPNGSTNKGISVVTDDMNNIYATGIFGGTIDFDLSTAVFNLVSNGSFDVFVLKLDPNGNFNWAKSIGGSEFDLVRDINIDKQGNLYVGGGFQGTVDFDSGPGVSNLSSNGGWDAFIFKLDKEGNLLWNKSFGSTEGDEIQSIGIDIYDNVYLTGGFERTVEFGSGSNLSTLTSNGIADAFISKLSPEGDFIWTKSIGGNSHDFGEDVVIDALGNFYLQGVFRNTVDFDPSNSISSFSSNGDYDIFIQKYDCEGDVIWTTTFGGSGYDEGNSLCLDINGNVIFGGIFSKTANFDPNNSTSSFSSNGGFDGFVSKYSHDDETPIAYELETLIVCDTSNEGIYEYFDTSTVESDVLGDQSCMLVTYYDEDGNELESPLPNPFKNTTPYNQKITVRVSRSTDETVFSETILTLEVVSSLSLNKPEDLYAEDQGNGYGVFDTSEIESQIVSDQTGIILNYFDSEGNDLDSPFPNMFTNTIPYKQIIYVKAWYENNPDCYSETSFDLIINMQEPPPPIDVDEIIMDFPNFFTPNNDGNNDFWNVTVSTEISSFLIFIYDRFGKILKIISSTEQGWDGYYNGSQVPATDYWFMTQIKNLDGTVESRKGHFSLIRR